MDSLAQEARNRILILGHDTSTVMLRSAQLTLAGWNTVQAMDWIDALTAVRSHDIDLALLILHVDDMVAMDLPAVLRQVTQAAYLPILVLAQNAAEPYRCKFLDCGADDVLEDHVSAIELIAHARGQLRIKHLQDELANSRQALREALNREQALLAKTQQDNDQLRTLAATDPLTRTQNVRSFQDILEHEYRTAVRYQHPLSLLMLDIDHFKVVNDSYGHPTGDYVLKELAVILKQSVRDSDVVCRTGGEEFSIILPRANDAQAAQFAERVRRQVQEHLFSVYGQDLHVTISIGWSSFPVDSDVSDCQAMVYLADQALLNAKQNGRDRVTGVRDLDPVVLGRLRRQLQMTAQVQTIAG